MLKRIRAAIMMALTWSVVWTAWGALAAGIGLTLDLAFPLPFRDFGYAYLLSRSAIAGATGGLVFAGILGVVDRCRSPDAGRTERLKILGTLAGLVVPVIGGMAMIEKPGLAIADTEIVGAALLLYVVPGLFTSYGTLHLALVRTPEARHPTT